MNVRLKYFTEFTAGVYYNGMTLMNNYRLNLHLLTIVNDTEQQNIALNRLKYFIRSLDSTVFIKHVYAEQCNRLINAGFTITTLPEEPVDQVLGIMLYSKLNAIMEDRMIVTQTEIASELGEQIVYLHDEEENWGAFEEDGWWTTGDPTHCDVSILSSDNVVAIKNSPSWYDLNLMWQQDADDQTNDDNKLVFADFSKDETK